MISIIYSIHFLLYFFFFSFKSGKNSLMMESYCLCHVQLSMTIVCMQLTFWIGIPLNFRIMLITLFTYHYGILPLFTQNISFKSSNSDGSNTTDRLNCFLVVNFAKKKKFKNNTSLYSSPKPSWSSCYSLYSFPKPSLSSCWNEVWHILFPNILLKQKEKIYWLEENFHICINAVSSGIGFMVFNVTTIFQLYRGSQILWLGLMLSCLKPLSTISQFYWWKKPKYQEKNTDKRYHIILYRVSSCQNRVRTHTVSSNRHWLYK